jgi:hypothetical protein
MEKIVVFVALIGLLLTPRISKADYQWYTNQTNGHQYCLTQQRNNWIECENEAAGLGGHLVTINDAAENIWLNTTFSSQTLWIGFYQPANTEEPAGGWQWISGEPVIYINWNENQPNELLPGDDYALMNSVPNETYGDIAQWDDGSWQDVPLSGWPGPHYGIIEVVPEPLTISFFVLSFIAFLRHRKR